MRRIVETAKLPELLVRCYFNLDNAKSINTRQRRTKIGALMLMDEIKHTV